MIRRSTAEVHLSTAVQKITKLSNTTTLQYLIESTHKNGTTAQFQTDGVVLACPIEFSDIEFVNIPEAIAVLKRKFRHWYVTVVRAASVSRAYFNVSDDYQLPDSILTTVSSAQHTPFNVVQLEANLGTNDNLFKIFSNGDVQNVLAEIFVNVSSVTTQFWPYTFPELVPVSSLGQYQPIQLSEGMFYLNTMESVASAMEGSVIAGRNVAQLLKQQSDLEFAPNMMLKR